MCFTILVCVQKCLSTFLRLGSTSVFLKTALKIHTTSTQLLRMNVIYRSFYVVRLHHMKYNASLRNCWKTIPKHCFWAYCFLRRDWTYGRRSGVRIPFSNFILLSVISTRPSGSWNVRSCHIFPVRQKTKWKCRLRRRRLWFQCAAVVSWWEKSLVAFDSWPLPPLHAMPWVLTFYFLFFIKVVSMQFHCS